MSFKYRPTILFIAFLQALGLTLYTGFVGSIFINGEKWFGSQPNFLGPTLFLLLFVTSAIVCSLIFLGYPFYIFWVKKNFKKALTLVALSTTWLIFFILMILGVFAYLR